MNQLLEFVPISSTLIALMVDFWNGLKVVSLKIGVISKGCKKIKSNLNILFWGSKPLNVTINQFNNLTKYYHPEINSSWDLEITPATDDEILTIEEDDIEALRKIILESQLNYWNNANQFIDTLEGESEDKIYHALLNLNDIRYIQHCISNLSYDTLKRLLSYIELMEENKHNLINTFMEEAIKRSIHSYEKNI